MNKPLVLIVDDKEENRYLLRLLLEGAGLAVAEATHGGEGLTSARATRPDLVISDILMPVMDGFAFCREWKCDPGLRDIPFAFYTATYTDGRDRDFSLSIGADDFIVKPQEPEALVARIRELLDTASRPAAAPPSPTPPP
ncbi:MAG: response regulator, partial [Opitutae bacterium]|nr:response regulator [Opitutae bacterium]